MNKHDADVMYVRDIARALGRTEAAIRAALRRRSESVPHQYAFRIGRQIAVRRSAFRQWLASKERGIRAFLSCEAAAKEEMSND